MLKLGGTVLQGRWDELVGSEILLEQRTCSPRKTPLLTMQTKNRVMTTLDASRASCCSRSRHRREAAPGKPAHLVPRARAALPSAVSHSYRYGRHWRRPMPRRRYLHRPLC